MTQMTVTDYLTGALVLVTTYYAWVTYRILKANEAVVATAQKQSEAISRPYIQISLGLVPDSPIFKLHISNTGQTAAYNLRLHISEDLFQFGRSGGGKNLRELNAFSQIIESFSSGTALTFWLGSAVEIFSEKEGESVPKLFHITAEYQYAGKSVSEKTTIDFRPYLSSDLPREPVAHELKEVKKALEKIQRAIESAIKR